MAKAYRVKLKEKALKYRGGKCVACGYDKHQNSLEFHHVNPEDKEFSLSDIDRRVYKTWEEIKKELDKCVILCSNCHKELHGKYNDDLEKLIEDKKLVKLSKTKKPIAINF